uniref:Uncharacterized protein n=1 Tax=Arundo donax TaxID=35708 RepID=A0A0A9BXA0_ARUDO
MLPRAKPRPSTVVIAPVP